LFFADKAHAREGSQARKESDEASDVRHFQLALLGGWIFYSFLDQDLKYQGRSIVTSTARIKSVTALGLELSLRPSDFPISVGLLEEWNQVKNENGPNDNEIGSYLLLKGHLKLGQVDV
jgi:hypothetical protein